MMGSVTMCCGHKAAGNEWMQSYYWKNWEGLISNGCLCKKCVPVYRAVRADSWEEASELLVDDTGVTLQDICASWDGAERRTEIIGGTPFDIVEIPPREKIR